MSNSTMKIDLIFQANTQAALNNIQQLNNLLNQISTNTTIGVNGGSLDKAVQSAQQLQTHLAQAVNVDTGKLDLNKLNSSLKQSGTNLQTLVTNLQGVGTQGQQAFVKLANSIASAQTPMLQVNQKLKEFGTTLLNTVKWQVASSMIHGVQGAIQGAVSYAKDLNTALNDIRIVTGKSIDDMSKFTQTASKAAKELSSTTTEYAKAALIFYQQGLDGKAVEDRAEVVLKMAQVTGESAESISSQMTAVWNNFYDGSKSLQYYADVLTKLGAATASSTDEITQGLEKFAAIADTVGLSYEYAAASLATVVAETRQAPEVVGTAFKTLFARLEGLSLGDTLEDGTDLNKYSEALAKVGVQIKNQNGELKDADAILDETAEKWRLLSKDQQVALAQTVGGMRQYSQFISLMDNWEDVEVNVKLAEMSEGELTKQQKIWSESWEAAGKRVEQSKNEVYSKIIDDKTMIKLADVWSILIDRVGDFIDRLGGVGGTVMFLVNIFSRQLFPLIQNVFTRLANNISVLTGSAAKQVQNMQNMMREEIAQMKSSGLSPIMEQQLTLSDKLIMAKQELAQASKNMTNAQRLEAERKMAIIEMTSTEIQKSLELQQQLEKEIELLNQKAVKSKDFKIGAASTAGTNLNEEDYKKEFGTNKEDLANRAASTTKSQTKRGLRDLGETFETSKERERIQQQITERRQINDKVQQGAATDADKARLKELDTIKNLQAQEKELEKTYETRKKALQEILRMQEAISQGKEASLGQTEGFVVDSEQKKEAVFLGGAQEQVAKELGGSVQTTQTGETQVVAEASLANLEKAYKLQGKYDAALKKSKAISSDLISIRKKQAKELSRLTKEQSKYEKNSKQYNKIEKQKKAIMKETVQGYQNSKESLRTLAQTAGASETELKELDLAFDKLNSSSKSVQNEGMNQIDGILKKIIPTLRETGGGVDNLVNSFLEMMGGKIPDDQLEALRSALERAGLEAAEVANIMDQLTNSMNRNKNSSMSFSQALGNAVTNTMQVVGAVQGAVMAIQSLGNAFDEDATPMENFSNYLMGMMGLLPMVSTAIQLYTQIHGKNSKKRIADNAAEQTSDAVTAGGSTLKGAIQSLGVPAGPIVGVALAAAVVAMILGGVFSALSSKSGQQSEGEKKEEALGESVNQLTAELDAAKEAAEGFKDAVSDYSEGINSLKELDSTTQEYQKTLEETNEKARELIETYGLTRQDYKISAKGIIEIDEGALEKKQAEFNRRITTTSTQLNLDKSELAQVSAENKVTNTDLDYKYTEYDADVGYTVLKYITDDEKLDIAEVAEKYGVDEAGVELSGDDLKQAIVDGLTAEGNTELAQHILGMGDDDIARIKSFGASMREATDASNIYAEELLSNVSKMKYDGLTSELAGEDTGLKELMDSALIEMNDNAIDEEGLSQKAIDIFDAAEDKGDRGWDSMSDDNLTYVDKETGKETSVNGEFGYMLAAARDVSGNDDLFKNASDYTSYGISADLAEKLVANTDVKTADLLKATYEAKGYTDVTVEDKDGKLVVSAKGNEAAGLDDVEDKEVSNTDAAGQFADFLKGEAVNTFIANNSLSEEDARKYLTQIQGAAGSNKFGADFTKTALASIQSETNDFDFSGIIGQLNAEEVAELRNMSAEEIQNLLGITDEMLTTLYGEGFTKEDLADKFKSGLQSWDFDTYKEQAEAAGVAAAEALELDPDEFKAYRDAIAATTDAYDNNVEGLNAVTIANQRLDRGVKKIADSWEDINDVMSNSASSAGDLATVMPTVNEGLQDILNLSDEEFELLSPTFAQDNWSLIQDVMNGVEGAVDELRDKAGQDILFNIEGTVDADGNLREGLSELNAQIASYDDKEFKVGVAINDAEFLQNCQNMIDAAGMTAKEAEAYFASMGYDAEIEEKKVDTTTTRDIEYPVIDERTGYPTGEKKKMTLTEVTGTTAYAIKTITPTGSYGGGVGVNSTASSSARSGASGDSSPAEKVERTKKSDVVNRYEEIEDKLDDIRDAAEKAAGAMDRLYGADRIKAMKDQNKYLEEEVDALKEKRKQAEQYLKEDTEALKKVATEAGVRLEIDGMGNVTNYTEQMTRLYDQLAAAEAHMDTLGTKEAQDSYQETHVQPIQDAIAVLKDGYDTYKDSREAIEDLDVEIQEAIYAWQDSNAEILNYEIELQVEMDERELQKIEYYLSKMEDDFYSTAESAALIGDKIALTEKSLQNNQNNIDKLKAAYEAGEISQSAYIEGLKEEESKMYDNLQTLQELNDTMMNYYGETLNKAQEELTEYTDKMDNMTSVLDHYRTLLDLTGQSQNFKVIGTVLEGQVKTIENSYQVAKENYEWFADEAIKKKELMNEALARGDVEAAELYENEWKAAEEKMRESQDNMLSMAEEWASKLKEILENKLADISSILENALTGGRSFDELSMQMEHAQGIQEEYLTTTNKIYETNKMIRNAQNEIDKTTNTVAKQKLKAFQQETQQLQDQSQLSQFELDIQQKKYDLLLAEIALEEAQNAKSTVRLQRDSEGNFGYVYTADQSQVSGAEQGVEDAENALYNTRLEGANNYASQRQELLQGLYDSLTNLDNQYYVEGVLSEEEYNRQKEAIQSYYFEKLGQNSELYAIATGEDSAIVQEAWSTSFEIMDQDAKELVQAVDEYLSSSKEAFDEYSVQINKVAEETGVDLESIAGNVKGITDESDKLKNEIVNEVIPSLQDEVDQVSEVTGKYAEHRTELGYVMQVYEDLLDDVNNVIQALVGSDGNSLKDSLETIGSTASTVIGQLDTIQAHPANNGGGSYVDNNPDPSKSGGIYDSGYVGDLGTKGEWVKDSNGNSYFKATVNGKTQYVSKSRVRTSTNNGVISYHADSVTGSNVDSSKVANWVSVSYKGESGGVKFYTDSKGKMYLSNQVINGRAVESKGKVAGNWDWFKYGKRNGNRYQQVQLNYHNPGYFSDTGEKLGDIGGSYKKGHSAWVQKAKFINGKAYYQIQFDKDGKTKGWVSEAALSFNNSNRNDGTWPPKFDTGGYTGEWGPEGKWAVLHQKELVLNASQTKDLFMTMELLDSIVKQIDLMAAANKYTQLRNSIESIDNLYKEQIAQEIHIEANFPNATDRNEIYQALEMLANDASQFINR